MMVAGTLLVVPAAQAFPGTNGELVFASNRIGPEDTAFDPETLEPISDFDIYTARPDGSLVNLTTNNVDLVVPEEGGDPVPTAVNDLHPVVSPDGKRIAFTSNRLAPDGSTDPDIYVMNIDGTGVEAITADSPGAGGAMGAAQYEPAWSPDGTQLAYRYNDGLNADVYVIDLATKQTRQLTGVGSGPAGYDAEPAWSPDGTKLLISNGKGPTVKIQVIDLATGAITDLIDEPGVSDATPAWSPDGTKIAFRRGDEGAGAGIWVAPATGGAATQLSGVAPAEGEEEPAAYSDLNPAWSPDGTQIAFQSNRPDPGETVRGDPDIYVMNAADGSGQTRHPASAVAIEIVPEAPEEPEDPEEPGGEPAVANSDITPDWQTIPIPPIPPTLPAVAAVAGAGCKVLPPAPAPGTKDAIKLTEQQLLINQRIGQAAIRRLAAVTARLNAGLSARDLCGYSIGPSRLAPTITTTTAAASLAAMAPADPEPIKDPGRAGTGDRVRLTTTQLLINQRIYQAALRRARAIAARIDGGLTGGDIRNGQVVQGKLYDRLQVVAAAPSAEPAPTKTIIPARGRKGDPSAVTLSAAQLKINQRIAQAGVREANALIRRLETGLSGTDLQTNTLTAADLG